MGIVWMIFLVCQMKDGYSRDTPSLRMVPGSSEMVDETGDYVRYCCGLHIRQTANLIKLDLNCGATYEFGPLNPVTGKEGK